MLVRGDDYNTPGNDDNDDEDNNPDDDDDANNGDGDGECYLFIINRPETVKQKVVLVPWDCNCMILAELIYESNIETDVIHNTI